MRASRGNFFSCAVPYLAGNIGYLYVEQDASFGTEFN